MAFGKCCADLKGGFAGTIAFLLNDGTRPLLLLIYILLTHFIMRYHYTLHHGVGEARQKYSYPLLEV